MNEMYLWIVASLSSAFIGLLLGYFLKEKRHHRVMQALFNEFSGRNSELSHQLSEADAFAKELQTDLAKTRNQLIDVQVAEAKAVTNLGFLGKEHRKFLQDRRDLIDALAISKNKLEIAHEQIDDLVLELRDLDSDHNKRMRTHGARAQAKKMRVKHAKELAGVRMECISFESLAKRYAQRYNTLKGTVQAVLHQKVKLPSVRDKLWAEIQTKYDENRKAEVMQ